MDKELAKLLTGEQFKPKQRFLAGLTLATTFHRHGRAAFIENAQVCGFSAEEISAMLGHMRDTNNLPTRPGYTPE